MFYCYENGLWNIAHMFEFCTSVHVCHTCKEQLLMCLCTWVVILYLSLVPTTHLFSVGLYVHNVKGYNKVLSILSSAVVFLSFICKAELTCQFNIKVLLKILNGTFFRYSKLEAIPCFWIKLLGENCFYTINLPISFENCPVWLWLAWLFTVENLGTFCIITLVNPILPHPRGQVIEGFIWHWTSNRRISH